MKKSLLLILLFFVLSCNLSVFAQPDNIFNRKLYSIDDMSMSYNNGRISSIGNMPVSYNNGRISSIGNMPVSYSN